ncbi:MAG: TIGR00725 family protein [Deltaproteobacteria bacterium]|nr:TIGR00725 family protein [Deltaproteobacteria bacterium]
MSRTLIGIIGLGLEDEALNKIAGEVGALIGSAGLGLVNGGLFGVMQASARGCRQAGGLTIGLLPGIDPKDANPYIDIPIPTGMGEMRNLLIVRAASALIAIGGGYGTLSEIALGLKSSKPVIGINTWDISPNIIKAATPSEAVELALKSIKV